MKILFLTSRIPYPPHRGDKLRVYSFIQQLSKKHQIYLISFTDHRITQEERQKLSAYCKEIHTILLPSWFSWFSAAIRYFSQNPSQVDYYRSRCMRNLVHRVASTVKPDITYIHLFRMMQYASALPSDTYSILDLTDVISKELFRRVHYHTNIVRSLLLRESWRIRLYERTVTQDADEIWVISAADRLDLIAAGGVGNIVVIPNGHPLFKPPTRNPIQGKILFYGYASTDHNRNALSFLQNEIMPLVHVRLPHAKLSIIGAGGGVFVKYPSQVFSSASMLVAPIRFSAGTQNKIIEAMYAAVPVITSPFGNEGIKGTPDVHLAICGTAKEFANKIIYMLQNENKREEMGTNGSHFIQDKFSWNCVEHRITEISSKRANSKEKYVSGEEVPVLQKNIDKTSGNG